MGLRFHRFIFLFYLIFTAIIAHAQQDAQYSQYLNNTVTINPAYAAAAETWSSTLLHRSQWVGFDGAPVTQTLSFQLPLSKLNMGLGLSITNDKIGPSKETGIYADYAYRINLSKFNHLVFGVKSGIDLFQRTINAGDYNSLKDNFLANNIPNIFLPNFGWGAYFYARDYFIGLSTPRLLRNQFIGSKKLDLTNNGKQEMHFFLLGGCVYIINKNFVVKPSLLTKVTINAPISMDLNINFLVQNKMWLGLMFRFVDAFGVTVQYQISNNIKAGYAFEKTVSNIGTYSYGSHEIMVSFSGKSTRKTSFRYF